MWKFCIINQIIVLAILQDVTSFAANQPGHGIGATPVGEDSALFLTPYIEKGKIKEALKLATVRPAFKNIESFSGFLTINKTTDSNLFFWLFKSQRGNWQERPLVVWLSGGPGTSSLVGLLFEQGPYKLTESNTLKRRRITLNRDYNMLFIDNPIGAGFSYTSIDSGYARTDQDTVLSLYEGLSQLYQLFPALRRTKLFFYGNSYAGKSAFGIGCKIHEMNEVSVLKMPLAGVMVSSAFMSALDMMYHAAHLQGLSLIDSKTADAFKMEEDRIRNSIKAGDTAQAYDDYSRYLGVIAKTTGLRYLLDFVNDETRGSGAERDFLNDAETKRMLHVGDRPYQSSKETKGHMRAELMTSGRSWLEKLLSTDDVPILIFSGTLDLYAPYYLSLKLYDSLRWPRAREYSTAKRCPFRIGDRVAWYSKTTGTFTEVLVRNAGHLISFKQRKWEYVLMDRFMNGSQSFKCD
ncbi:venom serine carboxypeptidase-like [Bemisia tabaci]|uniref:venom serine carboxypeptidase-like n=1 Tax=Bemisia tabaci TaxID=7038 RepID=UPI003B289488